MSDAIKKISGVVVGMAEKMLRPNPPQRDNEAQLLVDKITGQLVLYHFDACPYCLRVRRSIDKLGLHIEKKDILHDPQAKNELVVGGGRAMVPCLRIRSANGPDKWLYESNDIVHWLEQQFA